MHFGDVVGYSQVWCKEQLVLGAEHPVVDAAASRQAVVLAGASWHCCPCSSALFSGPIPQQGLHGLGIVRQRGNVWASVVSLVQPPIVPASSGVLFAQNVFKSRIVLRCVLCEEHVQPHVVCVHGPRAACGGGSLPVPQRLPAALLRDQQKFSPRCCNGISVSHFDSLQPLRTRPGANTQQRKDISLHIHMCLSSCELEIRKEVPLNNVPNSFDIILLE